MRNKYDWSALKLEFFQSEHDDVSGFVEQRLWKKTAKNSLIANHTKGRTKEKKEYKDLILDRALQLNMQKQAKELELPMDTLKKAKNAAVARVMWMLAKKEWEPEIKLSIADIEKILRFIKTELGEPTTISKNENLNTEKIEWIHVLLWWNAIDSSKSVKNDA